MSEPSALRILIVDDDPFMVDVLTRLLTLAGVSGSTSAPDGRQGLLALDEDEYDLVFCDIDMPGMDGVEFLRYLRDRPAPPAVVVLSSKAEVIRESVEQLGRAHQLRILGSLPKPPSRESVEAVLRRVSQRVDVPTDEEQGYLTLSANETLALLRSGGLEPHYQPIHDAETGRVHTLEALARLRHPVFGLIGPGVFVPVLEVAGESVRLLLAILDQALDTLAKLRAGGYPHLVVAVNVSSADLVSPDLVEQISQSLERAALPPEALMLELTESRALHSSTLPLEILTRLRVRGIGLAVDDYGTGYASLKQLRNIPFTELKIDQSFVRGAQAHERTRVMLTSTLDLARELGLHTVAEGVEQHEEHELLRSMNCNLLQGFHLSRPLPREDLSEYLARSGRCEQDDAEFG